MRVSYWMNRMNNVNGSRPRATQRTAAGGVTTSGVAAVTLATAALAGMAGMVGCGSPRLGGTQPADVVINELRDENVKLKAEVAKLEQAVAHRLAEIDTLERERQASREGVGGVPGATALRMVKLSLDRFTGLVDTDGDGAVDVARVYVQPRDQHGRFLPVSATASVQAVALRADKDPVVLGRATYDLAAWDESYRSGFTGSHYTLELKLDSPVPDEAKEVTLQVVVKDGVSGVEQTAQIAVSHNSTRGNVRSSTPAVGR